MKEEDRLAVRDLWIAIVVNDHIKMKKICKELGVEGNNFNGFYISLCLTAAYCRLCVVCRNTHTISIESSKFQIKIGT